MHKNVELRTVDAITSAVHTSFSEAVGRDFQNNR
jgi:hypothetical protein